MLEPGSGLAFAGLVNSERGGSALEEILDAVLENAVGVRRVPPETVPLPAAELELLAGRYGHSELELELHADGDRLAVEAVEIGRATGIRTPLPPLRARSLGARRFALEGDEWERARFDFHPRTGAPAVHPLRKPARGATLNGGIAAGHHATVEAGLEILQDGGTRPPTPRSPRRSPPASRRR